MLKLPKHFASVYGQQSATCHLGESSLFAAANKRNKLKEFMIVGRMRVRSPKLDSSINGGLSLAVEFDKSAQLTELSLDSESNHALLKGSLPSHFGDPDDGHFSDDGKQEEEEEAEPKGKGRRIWSSHWLWTTWSQPFTWIIMLCRCKLSCLFIQKTCPLLSLHLCRYRCNSVSS